MILAVVSVAAVMQGAVLAQQNQPDSSAILAENADLRLWQTLRMDDLVPVLYEEALVQADKMAPMLFERGSDAGWRAQVGQIHDPQRLKRLLHQGMQGRQDLLASDSAARGLAFYETQLGQLVTQLELDGRRAMLDEDTEVAAIKAFADARAIDAPRAARIDRLIEVADLIDLNVASGLNAALAFSQGFAEAGGYQVPMTEAEFLSEVWEQEPQIRRHAQEWITAYLYLSYAPLSDDQLDDFIAFAGSDDATALWMVLQEAFDHAFRRTSYEMGQAAARHMSGHQL